MSRLFLILFLLSLTFNSLVFAETELPHEPVEIGETPQLFVDDYIIDNRWPMRKGKDAMVRKFHQPKKHKANPVVAGIGGYTNVVWDAKAKLYRMIYQDFWVQSPKPKLKYTYALGYAQSKDGINWEIPKLGLYDWKGSKENNICLRGKKGGRASSPFLVDLPADQRRGYQFIMFYRTTDGMHLVGSNDCIHWEEKSNVNIMPKFWPDTHSSLIWDPQRKEYVCHTRATNRYHDGDVLEKGATRRVARMANSELWSKWPIVTQNILIPDAEDAKEGFNYIYGMPVRYYSGIYFGFSWPFKLNTDIYTKLMISRNGRVFESIPGRHRMIDLGPKGSWDSGMVFGSPNWVEKGDRWRIYYSAYDGPHSSFSRTPGIGLVEIRKEGFVSIHAPKHGGVICTRNLLWPGGSLSVNCDSRNGELKVRVCDVNRKPISGFGYDDCIPFHGDKVSHKVKWKTKNLSQLKGKTIRLEFFLKSADIYSFKSTPIESKE